MIDFRGMYIWDFLRVFGVAIDTKDVIVGFVMWHNILLL